MANSKDLVTTEEIIDSWNRKKYTRFQDYLNSQEYKEFIERTR